MLVYQRVNLHFPMVFPWFSHGFPMIFQSPEGTTQARPRRRAPRRHHAAVARLPAAPGAAGAAPGAAAATLGVRATDATAATARRMGWGGFTRLVEV